MCLAKGGMHGKGGGHVWQRRDMHIKGRACVAKGDKHGKGGMCGKLVCLVGGMHCRGTCMAVGMHGSVHGKGCAWQGCVHGRREAHCCKRYASYLNAFLLNLFLLDLANLT